MIDLETAYAALPPGVRIAAVRDLQPFRATWLDPDDMDQMAWEIVGALLTRYTPRPHVPLSHYLTASFRYAFNRAVNRTRPSRHAQTGPRVDSVPETALALRLAQRADTPDYGEAAACAELLRALPDLDRHALWLCAVEGLSFAEAGKRLGVPKASVFDAYKRAIAFARAYWMEDVA